MHQLLEGEYRILKSKYPCFVPQHRASRDPGMDLTVQHINHANHTHSMSPLNLLE